MNIDGGACDFLVHSDKFGLTQSDFDAAIAGAGCSLTEYTDAFDTGDATLANYDGVFLGLGACRT
jgi:hypothetical protein